MKIKISYTLNLEPRAVESYKKRYGPDWRSRVKFEAEVNGSLTVEDDWIPYEKDD